MALLIYLGPILRGYERIKWRLKETRTPAATGMLEPPIQKARVAWQERAFYLSYWSETGDEKEALLGGLMRFLVPQKYFVVVDQGWDEWDLEDRARPVEPRARPGLHRESRRREAAAARALRHALVALCRVRAARPMRLHAARGARSCDAAGARPRHRPRGIGARRLHRPPHHRVRPPHAPHRRDGGAARRARAARAVGRGRHRARPRQSRRDAGDAHLAKSCCLISGPIAGALPGRWRRCS